MFELSASQPHSVAASPTLNFTWPYQLVMKYLSGVYSIADVLS